MAGSSPAPGIWNLPLYYMSVKRIRDSDCNNYSEVLAGLALSSLSVIAFTHYPDFNISWINSCLRVILAVNGGLMIGMTARGLAGK